MPQGKDSSWFGTVPGIALVLALPFGLLAWLLAGAALEHAERHRQMVGVITGFREGLAAIETLETLRDLSPAKVYLAVPELDATYGAAHGQADASVATFVQRLRGARDPAITGHAERLQSGWSELTIDSGLSNPRVPFDNVERINDEVYAALSGLVLTAEVTSDDGVGINELLLVVLDTLRKTRRELGLVRSIAVYSTLRDGYFGSIEAEYLDTAWSNLNQLSGTLDAQLQRMATAHPELAAARAHSTGALRDYLARTEQEIILSPRIESSWHKEWQTSGLALTALQDNATAMLDIADRLAGERNRARLRTDALLAVGLTALYVVLTLLAVMLYRTRDAAIRAQAESRAKSLFLARMSHEIRTPLNGVTGLAELLADTQPTPRQKEYIDLIGIAGRSLAALVNDVLDHAKIEAGKLELTSEPIELRTLLNESVQVFGLQAGRNRTLVFCQVADNVPRQVRGDALRLRQVLLNLVGNAVKFTERGRVEVTIRRQPSHEAGDRLVFTVRDTGIGLSGREQEKLFDLFAQASSDVSRRYGGTGLGLSISRELVQLMGGSIGARSSPGSGSTFWFELPLATAGDDSPPAWPAAAPGGHTLLLDYDGHLAQATLALPSASLPALHSAANELDAQMQLGRHPEIRFVVLNTLRDRAEALAIATRLHAMQPSLHARLLVAVGSTIADEELATLGSHDVVARSVFSSQDLINLLTPPAPQPAGTAPASAPRRARDRNNLRVLVAEDNAVNRLVTGGMLERLGISAEFAEDGNIAVARYREQGGFDLVLMDLDMPVLDGNAAAREIRRIEGVHGWPRCRILAMSAHTSHEHMDEAREAGMDGQVSKPVTLAALEDAVAPSLRASDYEI